VKTFDFCLQAPEAPPKLSVGYPEFWFKATALFIFIALIKDPLPFLPAPTAAVFRPFLILSVYAIY